MGETRTFFFFFSFFIYFIYIFRFFRKKKVGEAEGLNLLEGQIINKNFFKAGGVKKLEEKRG